MDKNNTSDSTKKFSATFNKLILHHSLSFRKLAKALGISHPYLFRLSKGQHTNPGIDAVAKIAKFFKISTAQLLGDEKIDFKSRPKKLDPANCDEA